MPQPMFQWETPLTGGSCAGPQSPGGVATGSQLTAASATTVGSVKRTVGSTMLLSWSVKIERKQGTLMRLRQHSDFFIASPRQRYCVCAHVRLLSAL